MNFQECSLASQSDSIDDNDELYEQLDGEVRMTLSEFASSVVYGMLTPDDGCGKFATETEIFDDTDCFDFDSRPKEATHVVWFNK